MEQARCLFHNKRFKGLFSPLERTLALRQGIHSLSDYRFYLFVDTNGQGRVPTDLTNSRNDRKTQNCDKHNQGIKLSATALKVFQTFAANQGDKTCQVDYTIDDSQIHFHDLPR